MDKNLGRWLAGGGPAKYSHSWHSLPIGVTSAPFVARVQLRRAVVALATSDVPMLLGCRLAVLLLIGSVPAGLASPSVTLVLTAAARDRQGMPRLPVLWSAASLNPSSRALQQSDFLVGTLSVSLTLSLTVSSAIYHLTRCLRVTISASLP